ncbi:MAG TPA: hypothetical protein VF718_08340 [Allosphingosinicella sp.]|jgi:hypothetical protein
MAGPIALPDRLPAVSDRWMAWLRPLWVLLFAFAVIADVGGIAYVLHDAYENDPVFAELGLSSDVDYDGAFALGPPLGRESASKGIKEGSRIVAIDGAPLPPKAGVERVAARLRDAAGPVVRVRIQDPSGRIRDHDLTRSPVHAREASRGEVVSRDARMIIRLVSSTTACLTLLLCAVTLFVRRARDPVALLFSFAFMGMAATIDPPLMMWMALGLSNLSDVLSSAWWLLLVAALAAFPDGRFTPPWLRWVVFVAGPLSVFISLESIDPNLQVAVGVIVPLALLLIQPLRYRRLAAGIERQQIKWAGFGFGAGLVLIGLAVGLTNVLPPEGTPQRAPFALFVISLFSLGFVLMPLGPMVSLVRYRLWEADAVISRSAAYAMVTIIVGIVWAASADLVKMVVSAVLGEQNVTVATTLSAMLAAGVFAPTQSVVLGWTKRHFGKDADRLLGLPARLAVWRTAESAPEIGMRALAIVAVSVHAGSAAILALTPTGRELVAARDIEDPEALAEPGAIGEGDPRFPLVVPLEDEDGPVGTLLLGRRSDGNRFNRDEREAVVAIAEPLAEALRAARSRAEREQGMQQKIISAVEERLARLEAGLPAASPKPA